MVPDEMVTRVGGIVLSVDEDLHVLGWSGQAQERLDLAETGAQGRRCYDIVSAIDAETGRACRENCPLARDSARPGWAFGRTLEIEELGPGNTRLDCLQLKYVTPGGKPANLCFLGPSNGPTSEAASPGLRALEAIYPLVTGLADIWDVLGASLKAVVSTTSADGGEVFLLDNQTGELVATESRGLSSEKMEEFRLSALGDRVPDVVAWSRLPLLAAGTWPANGTGSPSGSYLCAPLVAEGRVLGALAIASRQRDFDVALASRVLFPVAAQLGIYLRWAFLAGATDRTAERNTASRDTSRLRIYALGPFRVEVDGETVSASRFQRLKALTLLKFLVAHRGRPVPRESVMEHLWPDSDPVRARSNLRVVLHALRRGLEPVQRKRDGFSLVASAGDLIYLDPSSRVWVDAEEMVQRARRVANAVSVGSIDDIIVECEQAAALFRGEYLEDELYSDWCLFERERLREVYFTLMKRMALALAEKGELGPAIDTVRAALVVDRGREDIHRELMALLWKVGRRDEALRQYDICARILREELDAAPGQETRALLKTMLVGDHR